MRQMNVEYALSLGVMEWEGLWRIEYLHPLDFGLRMTTLVPMTEDDERIGTEVDDIRVSKPGPRLQEVFKWLYAQIRQYPYYWPKEGGYVDRYGYDFTVSLGNQEDATTEIEISQIAYEILKAEIGIAATPDFTEEVDMQHAIVPAGGTLVKLQITLDRTQPISHVTLAPFSKFPMSIAALMYEQDIETFHPKQEIIFGEDNGVSMSESERAIRIQFPAVTARRITIILRQKHHEQNTYNISTAEIDRMRLWEAISEREAAVSLDATTAQDTLTQTEMNRLNGWAIYTAETGNKAAMEKWKKEFDSYKKKQAERNRAIVSFDKSALPESDTYRSEYEQATHKYRPDGLEEYARATEYDQVYRQYRENMTSYGAGRQIGWED